jgi:lysophospholipase L1-like esterase
MRRRYFYKYVLGIVSVLITVLAIELTLRTQAAFRAPSGQTKPSAVADYTGNQNRTIAQIARDRQVAPNTFNVYYFGGSTMEGMPFTNIIPRLVEKAVKAKINGRQARWINLGKSGQNVSYVKARIDDVVQSADVTHPSLIVIYSGHNEFLQYHSGIGFNIAKRKYPKIIDQVASYSHLLHLIAGKLGYYKLEIDDRQFFDEPLFPQHKYTDIIENYGNQLRHIVATLEHENIPVIISTLASNYSDFEPNRSSYCENSASKATFLKKMDEGRDLEIMHDDEAAIHAYREAQSLCSSFAETYYRLGKVYQRLGQADYEWSSYLKAVQFDRMPVRATSEQNGFILSLADGKHSHTVDTEAYLRRHAEDGNIGYNLMFDGSHPNLRGYTLIADLIAKKIQELYPLSTASHMPSESEIEAMFIPTNAEYANAYLEEAAWLLRLATWRFDPTDRLLQAEKYIGNARSKDPNNTQALMELMTIMYLRKKNSLADTYLNQAKQLDQYAAEAWLKNSWVREIMLRATDQ